MPVSHELKCVFVHIPRTGGTSIERALGFFHDWKIESRTAMFGLIQSADLLEKVSVSNFLQHATAQEVWTILPPRCADYFSFAFVRNPWDRMVSIFCRKDPNLVVSAAQAGIDLTSLSFEQFLNIVRTVNHVHLMPQAKFILDVRGSCLVDFVGRFERLEEDFMTIADRLHIAVKLERYNRSVHKDYREYYSGQSRQLVAQLYREDIEAFGYDF